MDDQHFKLTNRQKAEWIARKWAWACKDAPPESQWDLLIVKYESPPVRAFSILLNRAKPSQAKISRTCFPAAVRMS